MKILDVLSPDLDLNQRFFVEASAGCGKTFAIENVFVRLLLQESPSFSLEDILVLTFTKEATKELKRRIKTSIEQAIEELSDPLYVRRLFLKEIVEKEKAIQKLQEALSLFDQAQIFTLHGFCYRMLTRFFFESKLSLKKAQEEEVLSQDPACQVVRDFFLYDLKPSLLSPSQLQILLQSFRGDTQKLFRACQSELMREKPLIKLKTFEEKARELQVQLDPLLKRESLEEELYALAEHLKGVKDRSKAFKKEFTLALNSFVSLKAKEDFPTLLDAFLPFGASFFSTFSMDNLKSSASIQEDFSSLLEQLQTIRLDLESLYTADHLFALLLSHLQPLYTKYLSDHQLLTPQQILLRFQDLLKDQKVAKALSKLYSALIVDEFQDTDEVQWDIIHLIFLKHHSSKRPFFLVGDPKQSIYAFRDADIYTYLKASKALGSKALYTLKTNYRSQPHLIEGLNHLFESKNPRWMSLPKINSCLSYSPIQAHALTKKKEYQDGKEAIHWILYEEPSKTKQIPSLDYEENYLFPYLAREISNLVSSKQAVFSDFALLVRDRFQKKRLQDFLNQCHIPFQSTRPERLNESLSILYFYDLLNAICFYKESRKVRRLFLNPFFNQGLTWTKEFEANWLQKLGSLHRLIEEKGFLFFFEALMPMNMENTSFGEWLLSLERGTEIYQDWQELAHYGADLQGQGRSLFEVLEEIHRLLQNEDQSGPFKLNFEVKNAVHLLSLHMSKGLEFEIVIPIGLVNETHQKERTVPLWTEASKPRVAKSFCISNTRLYESESNAEKLRQLYVAMTRAKQRLYLPVVFAADKKESVKSAMTLFLEQLGLNDTNSLLSLGSMYSFSYLKEPLAPIKHKSDSFNSLKEPPKRVFQVFSTQCHSFSSLSDLQKEKESSLEPPRDFQTPLQTLHTLPAGPETGLLYHEILESIHFSESKIDLSSKLKKTPYEPWGDLILSHLKTLLNTPLPTLTGPITLKELSSTQILKEVEFLYPYKEKELIEECVQKGDFITGVIDLVFRHDNYVYFLDYKTNWLGPDSSFYLDVSSCIEAHRYDLQAKIYALALQKYLKVFSSKNLQFGGAFYWFLRGAESTSEPRGLMYLKNF